MVHGQALGGSPGEVVMGTLGLDDVLEGSIGVHDEVAQLGTVGVDRADLQSDALAYGVVFGVEEPGGFADVEEGRHAVDVRRVAGEASFTADKPPGDVSGDEFTLLIGINVLAQASP